MVEGRPVLRRRTAAGILAGSVDPKTDIAMTPAFRRPERQAVLRRAVPGSPHPATLIIFPSAIAMPNRCVMPNPADRNEGDGMAFARPVRSTPEGAPVRSARKRSSRTTTAVARITEIMIDTPRGSRCKYRFDEKSGLFRLGKLLPLGTCFPYNFGFVPGTRAPDGDPLDVLVMMDEPVSVGCKVPVRLIGVLEGKQTERSGKTVRNDRLIAVVETEYNPAEFTDLAQLDGQRVAEIEHFFVSYNDVEGRQFRWIGRRGPEHAQHIVEKGRRAAARQ